MGMNDREVDFYMADEFIKQKISRKAIDEFALKYMDNSGNIHLTPYTLANGEKIFFNQAHAILNGCPEFYYLVGQTFPFHDRKQVNYNITDLAFIPDKNGNKVPWSRNSKDITSLVILANACHFLFIKRRSDNKLEFTVTDSIPPITHEEG